MKRMGMPHESHLGSISEERKHPPSSPRPQGKENSWEPNWPEPTWPLCAWDALCEEQVLLSGRWRWSMVVNGAAGHGSLAVPTWAPIPTLMA